VNPPRERTGNAVPMEHRRRVDERLPRRLAAEAASRRCQQPIFLKKSFPLSSTRMKAGKSTTSIFQTASIPSSGKSMHSTFLMFSSASTAAGPPIEPR
jgi:hypothetical protein